MHYFFYDLNTQFANIGDLLINKSLITILSNKGLVYIEDKGKPKKFIEPLLNQSTSRLSTISKSKDKIHDFLVECIKSKNYKDDVLFLVYTPGDLFLSGRRTALNRIKEYFKVRWLKFHGVKIIRLGVSFRKLEHYNGYTESLHSTLYQVYGVRDKESLKLAESYHFSNLQYFPDLAWAFKWENKPSEKSTKKDYILLSFRSNEYGTEHNSQYLSIIIRGLNAVLSKSKLSKMRIVVAYQVEYDRSSAQEIYNYFSQENEVEFVDKNLELEDALKLYHNAKYIISNRLHVLLLGMIAETIAIPFIDLEGNKKIKAIYQDNGLGETIMDQKEDVNKTTDKLDLIIQHQNEWLQRYNLTKASNANIIINEIDKITNI